MKFFSSEWWSGCQSGDSSDAIARYHAYATTIRDRLTPELLALHERTSLHDARLLSLSVDPAKQLAVLALALADGSKLELRYSGLIAFGSLQTPAHALGGPSGYGDLGYDEIDVVDDDTFEHRMLFSSSIELRFRFRTLELS